NEFNSIRNNKKINDKINKWYTSNKINYTYFKNNFGVHSTYKPKVVHWNDRKKDKYFEEMLQKAHEYQEHIKEIFSEKGVELLFYQTKKGQYETGETVQGIEIKYDMKYEKTNNLYIEYEERCNKDIKTWTKSGILKDDNTNFFLIGNLDTFWIFKKDKLIQIYNKAKNGEKICEGFRFVKIDTSRGFIFPDRFADTINIPLDNVISNILEKNNNK
ncbi:MAG: hypothetical protein ACOCRX_06075, partial [Candidatus Woesearchaeota archaeon]